MFTGSMTALVTPFKNGKIDEKKLRFLIDRQIENGTSVIVPCGTTGESATLTHKEHENVIRITVNQVKDRIQVLAGAGSNSTLEAIRLHQEAKNLGANGTLHITPYYNKPTQEGLYQHFKAIAESADLPMILYNVPSRTCVNLQPETVVRLSKIKNIVGVKEASGDLNQIKKIIDNTPDEFEILSGEDAQTFDMLKLGANGAISVTANLVPQLCAQQWEFFKNGKIDEAFKIQKDLEKLNRLLFIETNPIPVKAALAMMGLIEEEYRLPLTQISDSHRVELENVLKEYQLL